MKNEIYVTRCVLFLGALLIPFMVLNGVSLYLYGEHLEIINELGYSCTTKEQIFSMFLVVAAFFSLIPFGIYLRRILLYTFGEDVFQSILNYFRLSEPEEDEDYVEND